MALRTRLEAGESDAAAVARHLGELARALLRRHPRDPELLHVVRSLAARGFVPAPPATLPAGAPEEVRRALRLRSAAELRALAAATVVVPDAAREPAAALAMLELFLLVPGEEARAAALVEALTAAGHDTSLASFELATRELDARAPESFVPALTAVSPALRPEAERRAALRALAALAGAGPHGVAWIVACRDGRSVANQQLAFRRRPALAHELGVVARWLDAEDPALAGAHAADREARTPADAERASALYAAALDAEDRVRVLAARAALLSAGPLRPVVFPAPPAARSALAQRLESMARAAGSDEAPDNVDAVDAAALELLGDRRAAARAWLALGLRGADVEGGSLAGEGGSSVKRSLDVEALAHATRLRAELRAPERRQLAAALRFPGCDDELALVGAERLRAQLLEVLEPDAWAALRLAVSAQEAPRQAAPDAPDAPDASDIPDSDPHHPENRLAAASDLLAAEKLEPAANILAALIRKLDERAPARLFQVVAQALAVEEPPPDLVHAAEKALGDERRCPQLLAALRQAPTAAFALHEALIDHALDPSRSDVERLQALEVWLGIWRATETAPDADAIRTLRQDEPALLVAAALRLGGQPEPLAALGRFLAAHPPATTEPEAFSAALLALSLGHL